MGGWVGGGRRESVCCHIHKMIYVNGLPPSCRAILLIIPPTLQHCAQLIINFLFLTCLNQGG